LLNVGTGKVVGVVVGGGVEVLQGQNLAIPVDRVRLEFPGVFDGRGYAIPPGAEEVVSSPANEAVENLEDVPRFIAELQAIALQPNGQRMVRGRTFRGRFSSQGTQVVGPRGERFSGMVVQEVEPIPGNPRALNLRLVFGQSEGQWIGGSMAMKASEEEVRQIQEYQSGHHLVCELVFRIAALQGSNPKPSRGGDPHAGTVECQMEVVSMAYGRGR
jgi:hypothetical protein